MKLRVMTDNDKAPRSRFPESAALIEANPALPDPFEFFDPRLGRDGRVETRADWEARREEIKDLAMYYFFGYRQPTPREASRLKIRTVEVPESVVIDRRRAMAPGTFSVSLPEGSYKWNFLGFTLLPVLDYRDGEWGSWEEHADMLMTIPAHTRRDAYVSVADKGGTAEIRLDALEIPVKGLDTELDGPYPALIVIGGLPPEQVKTLKARGYAYIAMNTGSVYGDGAARGGAYTELYPYKEGIYEYDSGALMGWAWGVSRIVDALLNDPSFNIDGSRTAVAGVSRNGKAALLAAAFDERISAAFPCDSGAAGLTGFRIFNEGRLYGYNVYGEHCEIDRVFSRNEKPVNTVGGSGHWLCSKARDFVPDGTERIPFDMHEVAALIAPRPLLAFTGENFEWVNPVSTAATMAAVREVYEFLGAGDDVALIVRDGAHANQDRDLPFMIAVMDRAFGRSDGLRVRRFAELMRPDSAAALDGSGAIYPERTYPSIASMNAVPYELDSSYQRWSRPGKYALWTETELVTEGFDFEIAACSDAPAVKLTLPDGGCLTAEVSGGRAVFALPAARVKAGRYRLETSGGEKAGKSVYFQGLSLADALRHGLNLVSTSPDGMGVGFTGKLVEKEGIEAYIEAGGKTTRLETGLIDGSTPVYIENYGVSLKQQAIPEGSFAFIIKNLRLAPLPGCVFELSLELSGLRLPNMFAGGALEGRAFSTQGERPTWNSSQLKCGPLPEWPLFPSGAGDTGERPDFAPTQSAFNVGVSLAGYDGARLTLSFSAPVNPRDFGVGFSGVSGWSLSWAEDARALTISLDKAEKDMTMYIFRLADAENNMIPGPLVFKPRRG